MVTERKVNRVKTTGMVRALVDDFYEEVRRAPEEGRLVAWCIEQAPFELLRAMDISFVHLGNYAVRTTTRRADRQFKATSEAYGFSTEVCTYARITAGCALLDKSGLEVERPEFMLPRPDLIIGTASGCQNMGHWFDSISRLYKVPSFCLDQPVHYDKSNLDRDTAFIKRQLKDLVSFLEGVSGHRLDWDRWKETTRLIKKASELRQEATELGKNIPAPISFFDLLSSMGIFNILRGTPQSVDYFAQLKAEVEDRVARGIGCVAEEKYRLCWDGLCMWYALGSFSEKLAARGAAVIAGPYTHANLYYEADWIDPDHPLDSLAEAFYCSRQGESGFLLEDKIDRISRLIPEYKLDGLIVHSSRTCRPWNMGNHDLMDAIRKKPGVPSMMIDADHADPSFYNEAEVDSTLDSFLELLESRGASSLIS